MKFRSSCAAAAILGLMGMYWGMDLADGGGFRVDENGAVVCDYVSEEYREFLEWAHQFVCRWHHLQRVCHQQL